MDDRALAFQEQVRPFVERYGRELCNDFYAYWTEPNPTGKRMRFDCRRKRNPGDSLHHSGLFCIVASSVQLKRIKKCRNELLYYK